MKHISAYPCCKCAGHLQLTAAAYVLDFCLPCSNVQVTRSSDLPDHVLSAQEQETVNAIVEASSYPLSIILVGVGDGPWDTARKYDDYDYAGRRFDNLQ